MRVSSQNCLWRGKLRCVFWVDKKSITAEKIVAQMCRSCVNVSNRFVLVHDNDKETTAYTTNNYWHQPIFGRKKNGGAFYRRGSVSVNKQWVKCYDYRKLRMLFCLFLCLFIAFSVVLWRRVIDFFLTEIYNTYTKHMVGLLCSPAQRIDSSDPLMLHFVFTSIVFARYLYCFCYPYE